MSPQPHQSHHVGSAACRQQHVQLSAEPRVLWGGQKKQHRGGGVRLCVGRFAEGLGFVPAGVHWCFGTHQYKLRHQQVALEEIWLLPTLRLGHHATQTCLSCELWHRLPVRGRCRILMDGFFTQLGANPPGSRQGKVQ